MVRTWYAPAALAAAATVAAQNCSLTQLCPQEAPCCSQYGECGVGAFCLGGCDPRMSYQLDACTPEPVCQSGTWNFKNQDGIQLQSEYLGNASNASWVVSGQILNYQDSLLLTMAPNSVGTVLASSTYMWYGNVKATMKTSRGQGVVTAFILFSDVKDEIDYEFIGVDLATAQTNFYFQGITNYTNSMNITNLSDTYENFHTYEIDWTPDEVKWLVDGNVGRTLQRQDTWNATSGEYMFPQTPSRVQFSIWPGGLASNPQGTINWAGGVINWDSQDIQDYGYDFATLQSVTVECYNATSGPGTNTGVSYTYDDIAGTNNTVQDGDKDTVLSSMSGTGLNMTAPDPSSTTTSGSSSTTSVASVPSNHGDGSGSEVGDGSSSSSATTTSSGSSSTGFSQGDGSGSGSGSGAGSHVEVASVSLLTVFLVTLGMVAL